MAAEMPPCAIKASRSIPGARSKRLGARQCGKCKRGEAKVNERSRGRRRDKPRYANSLCSLSIGVVKRIVSFILCSAEQHLYKEHAENKHPENAKAGENADGET